MTTNSTQTNNNNTDNTNTSEAPINQELLNHYSDEISNALSVFCEAVETNKN